MTTTPPEPEALDVNDYVAELAAQRNAALDQAAKLSVLLRQRTAERDEARAALAQAVPGASAE